MESRQLKRKRSEARSVAARKAVLRELVDPSSNGRVIRLRPMKRPLFERPDRCTKCSSSFVDHEPAFVHCRYCGNMTRIAGASLLAQEEFEIRSGLRLAS